MTNLYNRIPDYCRGCSLWLKNEKKNKLKKDKKIQTNLRAFKKIYKLWGALQDNVESIV